MASIQVVSSLPLIEQARTLYSFLIQQNFVTLPDPATFSVVTAMDLSSSRNSKSAAQLLRTELKKYGIVISQSHSYEVIARMCGFENWMRAHVHFTSLNAPGPTDGFAMRLVTPTGEEPFKIYESLPSVANEIINSGLKRLGQSPAPAFCSLTRGRKGLRIEFEPAEQLSFSFEVACCQALEDDVHFVDLDAESIRGFATRLERAIEMGHPGAIVSGTVMSQVNPHWYHPSYVLKSLRNQAQDVPVINEAQLFVMLEGVGLNAHTRLDASNATVFGAHDDVRIFPVWISQEEDDSELGTLSPAQFSSLIQRYLRLKRVLRQPFNKVMLLLSFGTSDPKGYFPLDRTRLAKTRQELGLSMEELAGMASISVQDLVRIEKYGYASESVIDKLAKSLGLDSGNALLPEPREKGLGIRLETAESLLHALSETHIWRRIISDHFTEAEKESVEAIAMSIQECGDLLQISEGVFEAMMNSKVDKELLKESLQESLDELTHLGATVIVSNSLHFAHNKTPELQGIPLHTVTMFFEKINRLRTPEGTRVEPLAGKAAHHGR